MIKILLSVFFLFFSTTSFAQSPYEINWKQEASYLGIGATFYASASVLHFKYVSPLTESEIFALDRASINFFDRNATFNFSNHAKKASDYFKYSSHTFPFLFLSHQKSRKDFGKIMALYGETYLIVSGLTSLTKRVFLRPRPFVFNELVPLVDKQKNNARFAFFSGHASLTAANSIFAAKVFSDYFPDSKWKPIVWSTAILVPVTTGYFRVRAGKHYPSDVITGVLIGGTIGYLIPHLHKKKLRKGLSITPTFSGAHLSLIF